MSQDPTKYETAEPVDDAFRAWAIVEQNGHRTFAGLISEQIIAGTPMLRIDVPGADGQMIPKWIGPTTVFAITPCTEAQVRQFVAQRRASTVIDDWLLRVGLPAPATDKRQVDTVDDCEDDMYDLDSDYE